MTEVLQPFGFKHLPTAALFVANGWTLCDCWVYANGGISHVGAYLGSSSGAHVLANVYTRGVFLQGGHSLVATVDECDCYSCLMHQAVPTVRALGGSNG